VNFPQNISCEVHYPPRSSCDENISYHYPLKIRVFCYNPNGNAALEIVISNNNSIPDVYKANFYIRTDAASLNRLGQKLANWNMRYISKILLYDEE